MLEMLFLRAFNYFWIFSFSACNLSKPSSETYLPRFAYFFFKSSSSVTIVSFFKSLCSSFNFFFYFFILSMPLRSSTSCASTSGCSSTSAGLCDFNSWISELILASVLVSWSLLSARVLCSFSTSFSFFLSSSSLSLFTLGFSFLSAVVTAALTF